VRRGVEVYNSMNPSINHPKDKSTCTNLCGDPLSEDFLLCSGTYEFPFYEPNVCPITGITFSKGNIEGGNKTLDDGVTESKFG
jgi:hypothetical protein